MDVRLAFPLSRAEEALPRLQDLGLGAEVYLDPALLEEDALFQSLRRRLPGRVSVRGSPTAAPRRRPWSGPCPWRRPWGWWCGGPAPWGCASFWRTATSPTRRP
ncbi:hypothetical protein TthHB5008_b22770 (plasmid) [Thermus thermophilus]|uniref:hypothetical protein n=1 Tax=Thermus thermophilus TaxID=274 RepID=UPI001AF89D6B|nr:hypothetical protein TthHB5002_b23080 [Thermus thermophilus]BCQ01507.1 hypothetical protein TthHB5008_b22770 [Thermus thermophilus]